MNKKAWVGTASVIAILTITLIISLHLLEKQEENRLYLVHKDWKSGFIDNQGKVIVPLIYDFVRPFADGLAAVKLHGKMGYINKQGRMVIDAVYDNALEFSEGRAAVQMNGKWGYIDAAGKYSVKPQFAMADKFAEGRAFVEFKENGLWGMINKNGKWVVHPQYKTATYFQEGVATVLDKRMNEEWIDLQGNTIDLKNIQEPIISLSPIIEGYAIIRYGKMHDKTAYIDRIGKIIPTARYDSLGFFSEGKANVCNFKKGTSGEFCGYINITGKEIIPLIYDSVSAFHKGLAVVSKDGMNYVINAQGERILHNPKGMYIHRLVGDLIEVQTDENTIGYMNRHGKIVWEPVK